MSLEWQYQSGDNRYAATDEKNNRYWIVRIYAVYSGGFAAFYEGIWLGNYKTLTTAKSRCENEVKANEQREMKRALADSGYMPLSEYVR